MHELPQALPWVQTMQHAAGVGDAAPDIAFVAGTLVAASLSRLAAAMANTSPSTDAQIRNVDFMSSLQVDSPEERPG
jgi:hypothetical protein